jgi:hypothetical protein
LLIKGVLRGGRRVRRWRGSSIIVADLDIYKG